MRSSHSTACNLWLSLSSRRPKTWKLVSEETKPTAQHLFELALSVLALDDTDGWERVWRHTRETALAYDLDAVGVRTDFRSVLKEGNYK